ncbi:MAG: uroporphyrinogen-III synthase [Gammaproteobacteria bacterium]|jgi:uroporphyrinogen-III synthase|nr:uroporphyrinogen-III synthase [Gammaproteobacteria bacterium]
MAKKPIIESPLCGKKIALPESRQLDVLAALFERRQAKVFRVPLVTILDTPDQTATIKWLHWFIRETPDYFIILTGEGLRRLLDASARNNIKDEFVKALGSVQKICRGPKPGRALKEVGLSSDIESSIPTSEGIMKTLEPLKLDDLRVAVQLYGDDPNVQLMAYLHQQNLAAIESVAPYVYAAHSNIEEVQELIDRLSNNELDLLAFTSKSQVKRLFRVAKEFDLLDDLHKGLLVTHVGAIGPIVQQELTDYGVQISVAPSTKYFMKPFVKAAESLFSA